MTERWASVEDVAKHLGVVEDSIYRIEHRGLPARETGRLWKCTLSAVDDWVRESGASEHDERDARKLSDGASRTQSCRKRAK